MWQGIGLIGWPIALSGLILNLLLQTDLRALENIFFLLIYPGILLLLIRVLFINSHHRWEPILLHLLILFSFSAVWYQVLNGYLFMSG